MKRWLCAIGSVLLFLVLATPAHASVDINKNVLKVGVIDGFPLYQFVSEEGTLQGINVDMMNSMSESANIAIEYQVFPSAILCADALEKGDIDIAMGLIKNIVYNRNLQLTDAMYSVDLCLVAPNSFAQDISANKKISGLVGAAENGHITQILSLQSNQNKSTFSINTMLMTSSQEEALANLTQKKVDYAICEKNSVYYWLKQNGLSDEYTVVFDYLTQIDYYMAVRSDDWTLQRILNFSLTQLKVTGEYSDILNRWMPSGDTGLSETAVKGIIAAASLAGFCAVVYVIISSQVRTVLKKTVKVQTEKLVEANRALEHSLDVLNAEIQLRRQIIEDSPSGMMILSRDMQILFMNRQIGQFFGSTDPGQARQSYLFTAIADKFQTSEFTPRVINITDGQRSQGQRIYRCNAYLLPSGKDNNLLLSLEDVTVEEKEKRETLEDEKNRALNTIIAGIAHEIKNPLFAIQTYSELLWEQRTNEQFMRSFSEYVPKETERISKLVESLVNYAKPSKGETAQLDLAVIIRECIGLTRSIAKKLHADVSFLCDHPVIITACAEDLRQAILNFLINALDSVGQKKHLGQEQASVVIYCSLVQNVPTVEIWDNGIGMSEEVLARCKEPFYTTKASGTGLGMSIAAQCIKENGGTVSLESVEGEYMRIQIEFGGRDS